MMLDSVSGQISFGFLAAAVALLPSLLMLESVSGMIGLCFLASAVALVLDSRLISESVSSRVTLGMFAAAVALLPSLLTIVLWIGSLAAAVASSLTLIEGGTRGVLWIIRLLVAAVASSLSLIGGGTQGVLWIIGSLAAAVSSPLKLVEAGTRGVLWTIGPLTTAFARLSMMLCGDDGRFLPPACIRPMAPTPGVWLHWAMHQRTGRAPFSSTGVRFCRRRCAGLFPCALGRRPFVDGVIPIGFPWACGSACLGKRPVGNLTYRQSPHLRS